MTATVGIMIGHACTECGKSVSECDTVIKETGSGCCPSCFLRDTHGLLDKFKVIDVADHERALHDHDRLIAQMVLARSEHAKAIRQLRSEMIGLIEEVALMRGRLNEHERVENHRLRQELLVEVMTEVRRVVHELPERLEIIERALPEIERRVKLRRRQEAFQPRLPYKENE